MTVQLAWAWPPWSKTTTVFGPTLKYSQVRTALGAVSWIVIVSPSGLATGRSAPIHSFELGSGLLGLLGAAWTLGSLTRPGIRPAAWPSPSVSRLAAPAAAARAAACAVHVANRRSRRRH